MRPGSLTEIIDIQRLIVETDDQGAEVSVWENLITGLRASVDYRSGNRELVNHEAHMGHALKFFTHYRPVIKRTDRLVYNGEIYTIISVDHTQRLKDLTTIYAEVFNG